MGITYGLADPVSSLSNGTLVMAKRVFGIGELKTSIT
jgi:hypothetical protein